MNILEWNEIFRGLFIGSTMVATAWGLSWYLTHIVCSAHERFQRDVIVGLKAMLEEMNKERKTIDP